MPDVYDELDVFGRPKSRVGGVPYMNEDDDLTALQNYILNLKAKEAAIEGGARTVRKPKEIAREGGRLPGYVHQYEPAYTVQEQERLRDETDPVRFMPIVRQGVENVHAIYNEGFETPRNILAKTIGLEPTFEDRWNNNLVERYQTWPEKMVRSGASLPGDVMSGRVMSGPGLRATDFSDIPGAPNPLGPMIERTQDLAGMAMGGSIPELAARGVDRNALGSGFVPKEVLTNELRGGTNVHEAAPRNIGRETMPEILARQRASEGYEAAIRDPETKKLYTGMWHEEVLDKIAKDKGVPKEYLPDNLIKGYVNDRGRFLTEEAVERMSQNRSKTAMFRADDEVGAAVAAMHATEGKAPELKVGQANLPAVIPQGGLPAPGTALNPISNRRGFLRGARDLMAAASNANKIVSMAEKLGQTPIPKNPKVPLKEIWKHESEDLFKNAEKEAIDYAREMLHDEFEEAHPQFSDLNWDDTKQVANYNRAWDKFERNNTKFDDIVSGYLDDVAGDEVMNTGTQFSRRQLPGATNYREHLMQMPEKNLTDAEYNYMTQLMAKKQTPEVIAELNKMKAKEGYHANRFYGDWGEPDIIGHSRVNDRQIPGVGKALHIEEIGSQLHEKGAKSGYRPEKGLPKGFTINEKPLDPESWVVKSSPGIKGDYWVETPEGKYTTSRSYVSREQVINTAREHMVPDLPFKKTYVDLAVNRMLHEAATQGYDAVSWTPHELQKKNYGNDSNKEILPRIEALAKKYGGKVEKHKVETNTDKDGKPIMEDVYHVKLTPEMKRIFGHDDFSFFPKLGPVDPLHSAIAENIYNREWSKLTPEEQKDVTSYAANNWKKLTPKEQEHILGGGYRKERFGSAGFKLRSDSEAGAAIGALRNSVAPTFYSGLSRTIERAPFETATPSQWMKHLRDTVGARQAEEFEHVGLEGRLGPLAEVKVPVERKAQGQLEAWKAANKGQRPPKELTDAASNENKRIVEQRLAEKGKEQPLTKAELLAHVAGNQPKFKEIVKGKSPDETEAAIHERAQEFMDENHPEITPQHRDYQDYFADAVHEAETEMQHDTSKYSDYQLPGGTNYREHLMTMPATNMLAKYDALKKASRQRELTPAEKEEYMVLDRALERSNAPKTTDHYSSHWDEPNVIVHTRMNDRLLGDPAIEPGDKAPLRSLHAEEFQSDLHQEGRKKGYKDTTEAGKQKLEDLNKKVIEAKENLVNTIRGSVSNDRLAKQLAESVQSSIFMNRLENPEVFKDWLKQFSEGKERDAVKKLAEANLAYTAHFATTSSGVPNFPFKKSWPDLAIKRWLREAADNDYDAVSWTPGEAQRDRFQLAHSIENLTYAKHPNGTYTVEGERRGDGGTIKINRGLPVKENELAQHVGEAVAEKIKNNMGQHHELDNVRTLHNTDLKVGGEGLVSFYDKTIKGKVEALVERFGGKVEKHDLGVVDKALLKYASDTDRKNAFVWSVKLTPEMKAAIRREGFPLFTAGPVMTPVDHDPFDKKQKAKPRLEPVDHDPFDKKQKAKPRLEPVDHDPFAQPTPDLGGTLNKLISATSSYRPRPRPIQNGFGRRQ